MERRVRETLGEIAKSQNLDIRIGNGTGGWPEIPWFGLAGETLAPNSKRGIYIAFLFDRALTSVALSLQQGITDIERSIGMPRARTVLARRGELLRARKSSPKGFNASPISLGATYHTGRSYEHAHVLGRVYSRESLASADLGDDLSALLDFYLSLRDDAQIVSLFNSVPGLDDADPELDEDARTLTEDAFKRKYKREIARQEALLDLADDEVQGQTDRRPTVGSRRIGQEALRSSLLKHYSPVCAACGNVVATVNLKGKLVYCLHAAHVISVELGGRTVVQNGLLLCPIHHWAFDHHCWWIDDERRIVVRADLRENPMLETIRGRVLPVSTNPAAALKLEAIRFHRSAASRTGRLVAKHRKDF
jgi:hypothetical protein